MPATTPPELTRLLTAANEHDRDAAWAAFLQIHTQSILAALRSLGRDQDLVMDRYAFVVEHLRADGCRRLRAFSDPATTDFRLWLFVVTRRLALDHYRHRYGRVRLAAGDPSGDVTARAARRRLVDLVAAQVDPADLSAPPDAGPDTALARSERGRLLQQALEQLPARDRLLLRYRFAEELSAREIADLMRFPSAAHVYRRLEGLFRTLREIAGRLGLEGVEP